MLRLRQLLWNFNLDNWKCSLCWIIISQVGFKCLDDHFHSVGLLTAFVFHWFYNNDLEGRKSFLDFIFFLLCYLSLFCTQHIRYVVHLKQYPMEWICAHSTTNGNLFMPSAPFVLLLPGLNIPGLINFWLSSHNLNKAGYTTCMCQLMAQFVRICHPSNS